MYLDIIKDLDILHSKSVLSCIDAIFCVLFFSDYTTYFPPFYTADRKYLIYHINYFMLVALKINCTYLA